jgi:carbamoyltransferase
MRGRLRNWFGLRRPRFENILSIASTGHGCSIALATRDGIIRSSVLDRWSGTKYVLLLARKEDGSLRNPVNSIDRTVNYLLSVGRGGFPPSLIFEDTVVPWLSWFLRDLGVTANDIDLIVTSESHFATLDFRLGKYLHRWFPNAWRSSGIEHHEIHQRQAFWQSGFDEAAVLTLDACGEHLDRLGGRALAGTISAMDARGRCRILKNLYFPENSPGLIYDTVNRFVGFQAGDEGKTMGLAPYGEPELFHRIEPLLQLHEDGGFDFVSVSELEKLFNEYTYGRMPGAEVTQKHMNVAFAGQSILEKIVKNAFDAALRLTGLRNIAYAGGVALNSVANDIAYRAVRPNSLYVCPNPGDPGHALGAALFGAYEIAGWPATLKEVSDYIGPSYTAKEMAEAAHTSGFPVSQPGGIAEELARCIANGYITARFDGRAEFGPRALGNRSILCDPRRAEMKDYLNDRVKHREGFRPFAPAVLEEEASDWFDIDTRSPYMLRVVPVRPERRDDIAATVHVDGSCRVQTVSRKDNPGFYDVIRAYKALTGIPVVLNTSFNIAGKPIVETPRDAVECFAGTDIDVLVLGDIIVSKRPLSAYREPRIEVPESAAQSV